jgi:hypothetical protein
VPEPTDIERDLRLIESSLRQLETEYHMFFSGHLPRPPVETRARVEKLLRRYDRAYIQSYADRFRLGTLQSRFSKFVELWDRGTRAREEGRPSPFRSPPREEPRREEPPEPEPPSRDRVFRVETVSDPGADRAKLLALYESLVEARKASGSDEPVPFHRFAQMVTNQVNKLRESGSQEVSFRVAVKDNKVTFTAQGKKGKDGGGQ